MRLSAARHDGLHLRSVTLRSADTVRPDALRARFALERALLSVDVRAAGLPPEAVLIVRRMAVGGDGVASRGPGGGTTLAQQVDAALREQGRTARRPWRDPGATAADAVWFEDEHELAACLVRDWLRGLVGQRWWWRGVLAEADVESWLRSALLSRGECLAPTLQRLASASLAAAWLARMDDADADAGVAAVVRAYGLPQPRAVVDDATVGVRSVSTPGPDAVPMSGRRASAMISLAARRRLQAVVPELEVAGWRPSQMRLLAYGLAVLRAPAEARSARFAADVAAWRPVMPRGQVENLHPSAFAGTAHGVIGHDDDLQVERARAMPDRRVAMVAGRHEVEWPTDITPAVATQLDDALRPAHASMPDQSAFAAIDDAPGSIRADARRTEASVAPSSAPAGMDDIIEAGAPASPPAVPAFDDVLSAGSEIAPAPTVPAARSEITTRHGGLFYLLNAALTLGLYGDFTAPRTQGLSLSPWDLLAWLGQHWFGRAFRRDPLWRLLADLAGRSPKRAPSWRVDPPLQWMPDDDWLRPWAPMAKLEHGVDRRARRLQLRHPDGFAVFDVPRDTRLRPAAQARALCLSREAASRARLRPSRSTTSPALPLDPGLRWLHRFADYMAARLMRALGTSSPREAVALLCRHGAELRCDASRVEIALSLAHLPLPVRVAGLDRDPGWIPAAGRDVRFHFS